MSQGSSTPEGNNLPADQIEAQMARWIREFVIELNLCPFARHPVEAGQLRITVSTARETEALLLSLYDELLHLAQTPATVIDTSVLVVPGFLENFDDYLDCLDLAEGLLADQGWQSDFQIASFHPLYRFADSPDDDPANYSNRSPWPAFHLLREASVSTALQYVEQPERIPQRNISLLRQIGSPTLERRLRDLKRR